MESQTDDCEGVSCRRGLLFACTPGVRERLPYVVVMLARESGRGGDVSLDGPGIIGLVKMERPETMV